MITELCYITGTSSQLKSQYLDTWEHYWLPKLSVAIRDNLSKTNQKRLTSIVDLENDLDDTCGTDQAHHTALNFDGGKY